MTSRSSTSTKAAAPRTLVQGPRHGRTPRVNEEPPRELRFEQGDERSGRAGDAKSRRQRRDEYPPARGREAGRTAGEMADHEITADDLSPETLLDEERSHTPDAPRGRVPRDTELSEVPDNGVGLGGGLDEAELADRDAVGRREAEAQRRRAREHAGNPNQFEPHEAAELAAAERERRRHDRR